MSKNNYLMTESASAQIEIDYLRDEIAKLKEKLQDEKVARALLRTKNYYVDNLWCTYDVQRNYSCSMENAQRVLDMAFKNAATMEQIFLSIDDAAETLEIKQNQD